MASDVVRSGLEQESSLFQRFAAISALIIGLGGIGYAAAFVFVLHSNPKGAEILRELLLMLGGPLTAAVFIALRNRVRHVDAAFAVWALLIGAVAGLGSSLHGGYDLANAVKEPPPGTPDISFLPHQADPRGLFTFLFQALAIATFSWLLIQGRVFPARFAFVGFGTAALLAALYAGRLTVYNPKSPGLYALALITGFGAIPIWYGWLGLLLWRGRTPARGAAAVP